MTLGATGGAFCGCGVCFAFLVTMVDLRKREVPVIEEADLLQVDSEPHRIFPWLVYSIRIQDLQCGKVCFFFGSFFSSWEKQWIPNQ